MMKSILFTSLSCLACITATAESTYTWKQIYAEMKITKPIFMAVTAQGDRLLVEQRGFVKQLPKDETSKEAAVVLDLSSRKLEASQQSAFEEGLVGFVLHPKFQDNQKCYAYYTLQEPKVAVLSEFKLSSGSGGQLKADPASEKILMEFPLPHWNHHGGSLVFGKDGMLYFGIGDGGGPQGGDPLNFAQNPFSYNGKILRIDVDSTAGRRTYGLPKDNPWVNKPGIHPELVAMGIRNPWGLAADADGSIWFADVGQNQFEEINILEIGGNYGWNYREGTTNFPVRKDTPPETAKFVEPIHVYGRDQGISITGGVFYAGKALPALAGTYVYGDWGSGRIWALKYDKTAKKVIANTVVTEPQNSDGKVIKPAGFATDENGEILLLDWNDGMYRLTAK